MTYSILARDSKTGEIGLASTTVSLAVGGLLPFFSRNGSIAISQAYALPSLGRVMAEELDAGRSLTEAIEAAKNTDPHIEFRQLAILSPDGEFVVHSGSTCRPWTGDLRGKDCLACGNVLAGQEVLTAMVKAFEEREGESLAERLICALEAGRDAGGQTANGRHLRERSASVLVKKSLHEAPVDLRVDVSETAVEDLRRAKMAVDFSEPYVSVRASEPEKCPSVVDFEAGLDLPTWFPRALESSN